MIQNILAASVVFITILYVIWRIYKLYITKNKDHMQGCNGCPSSSMCKIKELETAMEKKKEGCAEPERL